MTTTAPPAGSPADHILLTVILRQDQSRPVTQLVEQARAQGFHRSFPPEGIEVTFRTNVMGFGQVLVLQVPPARLREVRLSIERTAWGLFRTEVCAAYDFMAAAQGLRNQP
ncbi:hypothetical protein [Salinarimonas soli]|uniref:hypothetical protein n=1 Tax=Salinarimonas soli TaxID=1638099 RepID=UPI0016620AE9|nr:hypothetical protein [Salinarimonas soli]